MLELYDYPLSGNCYKVRLLCSLLGLELALTPVDFYPGAEHRGAAFRALNPRGQLPVLVDGDSGHEEVIGDSAAILVYLATRHDTRGSAPSWYPLDDPLALARIQEWLAHAAVISSTAGVARMHEMLGAPLAEDLGAVRRRAHAALRLLDDHLVEQRLMGEHWLTDEHPTIADIACFPYTALAGDGGVALDDYHAIGDWMHRIKRLPGFIAMPGIHPLLHGAA